MSDASERKRSKQFDGNASDLIKQLVFTQGLCKTIRSQHGTDGMRATGADADLEQFKQANHESAFVCKTLDGLPDSQLESD